MKINSSLIKDLEYNKGTSELVVQFTNWNKFVYYWVPNIQYTNLLNSSDSIGKYFLQNIKPTYTAKPYKD